MQHNTTKWRFLQHNKQYFGYALIAFLLICFVSYQLLELSTLTAPQKEQLQFNFFLLY